MQDVECLVIGGGPAGLTAAVYLARFRRSVLVLDGGASRAAWIPVSHNIAGFPHGVSGEALLARLREQATQYGARLQAAQVSRLALREDGGFEAETEAGETVRAARVLLATGGLDVELDLPGVRDAVQGGLVRYCPICDAYEVTGRSVGLIAFGRCRVKEALLLRAYTSDLSVLTLGRPMDMADDERRAMAEAGVAVIDQPVDRLAVEDGRIAAWHMGDGAEHRFDTVYTALGVRVRSDLALALGAEADEDGALLTSRHQETRVPGLFAAGDVVSGLSQVAVAAGHAAIAATRMNASLPFPRLAG